MAEQIKDFIAGGAGGICAVVSGHPLDTIKVGVILHCTDILGDRGLYPVA